MQKYLHMCVFFSNFAPDFNFYYFMKKYILLFCCLMYTCIVHAEISGLVVDDMGEPLIGVQVQAASGEVTTTDYDGYFKMDVSPGVELYVSFIGFKSQVLYAQPYNKIKLQSKYKHGHNKAAYSTIPWEMFVMLNGLSSFPFSPAVGVTFGMVRKGGWYVNLMSGFGLNYNHSGKYYYGSESYYNYKREPFFTGESSHQFFSFTGGGVSRFGKSPVFMYYGGGYGYKSVSYKTNNGKWMAFLVEPTNTYSTFHSVALETGLMCSIKGVAVSAGYECLLGFDGYPWATVSAAHQVKIGVGGMFKMQRR